jgi:hypothetical protein
MTKTTMCPHLPPRESPDWQWLADWIARDAPRLPWDGLYRAPCPCGRVAWWSAYLTYPLCNCPISHRLRPQILDDDL